MHHHPLREFRRKICTTTTPWLHLSGTHLFLKKMPHSSSGISEKGGDFYAV
jgi:hypothetical protein